MTLKRPELTKFGIGIASKPWSELVFRSPLDDAYMDAVDRAEQAQLDVLEAERAVERERQSRKKVN